MNSIKHTSIILLLLLFLSGCKSSQKDQTVTEPIKVLILLEGNVSPADLAEIKAVTVLNMKRTSRTENLWMVSLDESMEKVTTTMKKLRENAAVKRIEFLEESN